MKPIEVGCRPQPGAVIMSGGDPTYSAAMKVPWKGVALTQGRDGGYA